MNSQKDKKERFSLSEKISLIIISFLLIFVSLGSFLSAWDWQTSQKRLIQINRIIENIKLDHYSKRSGYGEQIMFSLNGNHLSFFLTDQDIFFNEFPHSKLTRYRKD
ncbi:MAG: hypothetical protein UU48_C0003G0062 [Candidatus Uhrbacteria bacterium GW2011_GWF2_41_16]|uniref:Uncharacterized protein n=2 Tax=Candidatus Uhriibacteriota TaxID=1752732 RepID=A0A0G0XNM0_9BACT|nr:MAG: hypothetical protein UU31_C0010G0006 [Candidatus Uhrbacteria bacterium GW2011_GWA2_41_10]KKR87435.1 MAG: hypothetical protein UU35_C0003G0062 [Candidatus Uhrbacteria bacterium GW2011_GWC2_41_11]KKR98390.1 MAG: hypothetical protein UU48_C0003G0062 [Candidatus Uhrbacteria bacterium GW2011_GWF2_41_16]HBP00504.1 hypothetical protein [Candidatus Uhrbacteria bacterium]